MSEKNEPKTKRKLYYKLKVREAKRFKKQEDKN